jgi:hypothetical protein
LSSYKSQKLNGYRGADVTHSDLLYLTQQVIPPSFTGKLFMVKHSVNVLFRQSESEYEKDHTISFALHLRGETSNQQNVVGVPIAAP